MCSPPIEELQSQLNYWGILYFSAKEITYHRRWDRNVVPQRLLWSKMEMTIQFADELRKRYGGPISVVSGYRIDEYNELVGGSPESEHKAFRALDLSVGANNHLRLISLATALAQEYKEDGIEVGIGIYRRFIHVDVGAGRGNRFWTG